MGNYSSRLRGLGWGGGALAATAAWWAVGTARAETAAPPVDESSELTVSDIEQLSLADLLDAPITAASRREERANRAPGSVSTMQADEIARYGFRTLAEILRAMRGVYVTHDRAYDYLGVQGFSLPGDYNSRVLVMIDGHRINDAMFDSALLGLDGPVDVDMIERVEFVRGPSSSVYGSSAFFGVVNVVTRQGAAAQGVRATLTTSSFTRGRRYDLSRATVAGGHVFDNGLHVYAQAGAARARGVERLTFAEYPGQAAVEMDGESYQHGFARARWRGLTLSLLHQERSRHDPTGAYGTAFGDSRHQITDSRSWVDLAYAGELEAPRLELRGRAYLDRYRFAGHYPVAATLDTAASVNHDDVHAYWSGGDVQLGRELLSAVGIVDRLVLSVGGDVQSRFFLKQRNFDVGAGDTVYVDRTDATAIAGLYAMADAQLATRLHLSAGLRLDHWSGIDSTLNPRLAAIWLPFAGTTIKAIYGSAFRGPNAYERFYVASTTAASVRLSSERLATAELVAEQYLGSSVRATASVFRYGLDALIVLTELTPGIYQFGNLGEVDAHGASAELEGHTEGGFRLRSSYAYQVTSTRLAGGAPGRLANSPRHLWKLHGLAPLWAQRLFAAVELLYTGARATPQSLGDPATAPPGAAGYLLTNLTLTFAATPKLALDAGVRNLLDGRYVDPASEVHLQNVIPQNGRSIWLRLVYNH